MLPTNVLILTQYSPAVRWMAQNRQGGDDLKILVRKDSGTQQLTDKDGFKFHWGMSEGGQVGLK